MRLVSIGDCVKPGAYRLHSCFKRAVNYEHRGRLVSVVDESIGPGPLNVVLRSRSVAAGILPAATAQATAGTLLVGRGTILFAGHRYAFTSRQRYHSALKLPAMAPRRFQRNLATFGALLRKTAPPHSLAFLLDGRRFRFFRTGFERAFAAQVRRGVQRAFHGDLLKGVADLKGCGIGLTPSGDDFIAGLLIGLNLLQKLRGHELQPVADAICRAGAQDSLFSNTALEMARQGRLLGRVKDVLIALVSGNALSLHRATWKLLAIGATSGADLGTGLFMTVGEHGRVVERWLVQGSHAMLPGFE